MLTLLRIVMHFPAIILQLSKYIVTNAALPVQGDPDIRDMRPTSNKVTENTRKSERRTLWHD